VTTQDLALIVIAISAGVVAVAFVLIALSVRDLGRDARRLAQHSEALITALEKELPPTIQQVRDVGASVAQLSSAAEPRLERLDRLSDEAEATLIAVREVSSTLNGLVRGPADTVSGVKRSVRVVGEGIASGADRLRKAVSGTGGQSGDDGEGD
jgi:uncharacterized protein YoxC